MNSELQNASSWNKKGKRNNPQKEPSIRFIKLKQTKVKQTSFLFLLSTFTQDRLENLSTSNYYVSKSISKASFFLDI